MYLSTSVGGPWLDTLFLLCGLQFGLQFGFNNMVSTIVEIRMDVDATKSKKVHIVTFICFRCLAFSGFSLHIYLRRFPLGIDLYLECYAPARLTRVIAQGAPCFSFAPSSLRIRTFGYNCYRLAPVDRTRASCHWQSSLLAHLSILLSSCLAPFFGPPTLAFPSASDNLCNLFDLQILA